MGNNAAPIFFTLDSFSAILLGLAATGRTGRDCLNDSAVSVVVTKASEGVCTKLWVLDLTIPFTAAHYNVICGTR